MPWDLREAHTLPEWLLKASGVPWSIPNVSRHLSSRFQSSPDAMFKQMEPIIGLVWEFKHLDPMKIPAFKHLTLHSESHPRYHCLGVNYWPLVCA